MQFEREIDAVRAWCDETDRIAMEHWTVGVATETKGDGTPVTIADREIERVLRAAIERDFPGDAIVGEEAGATGRSSRRWILDPIDGTKNYARGVPVFATLVALEADGELVLGYVSAPALRTRWWAVRGEGAFRDGESIDVSDVRALGDAHLCTGGLDWSESGDRADVVRGLISAVARQRGFGDFWGHMLVAQGSVDVMLELAPLHPWDVAAPKVIVEAAGGTMSSLDGDTGAREGPMISTNGALHEDVVRALSSR